MKVMLYIFLAALLCILLFIFIMSLASRRMPELGLVDGQLRGCPITPNCVSSEDHNHASYTKPFHYSIAHVDAWQGIKEAIIYAGGTIVTEQTHYLHAEFVTPVMRFKDDLELRLVEEENTIHIRSASRVGHSDLGVNRKRVARIRKLAEKDF